MGRRIAVDPITRLEGHGKIEILIDDKGDVEKVYFQVPDFKGFEKFCEGRAAEEMPALTQKICGVCPTAHHTASVKALDALFNVTPPPAAVKIRELMYHAFMFEDHLLHFYFLGGPDLFVGPHAPKGKRNFFGITEVLGLEAAKKLIRIRKQVRQLMARIGGSALYPVHGLPGGVSKALDENDRTTIQRVAKEALDFSKYSMKLFNELFLEGPAYSGLLKDDRFYHETYYLGMVDDTNRLNFYDGGIRIVAPDGNEHGRFEAGDFQNHLEERVETWSYMKPLYLKDIGWHGYRDGPGSGIYRVGPLARLNVAESISTALAQEECERMFDTLGGRPAHQTMAYYWARLVEILYAAEKMIELGDDEMLTRPEVRILPGEIVGEGIGVCEAPRGTLFHHYRTDRNGIVKGLNLLVATQNSAAAICMSVEKVARRLVEAGEMPEGEANMIEMAFRAYDPCLACATH
jgi:F420-non-reducing hydrogenase large subunit